MKFAATATAVFLVLTAGTLAPGTSVSRESRANAPRAVEVARTTVIPNCTRFVDAAFTGVSNGTALRPHKTIAAAVSVAGPGAVICVAQGIYRERLRPGTKPLTLAGGFQRNRNFTVRDSALYVSKAQGNGTGSFLRIEDPGPSGNQLTAIDGFEITGYAQAIYRDFWMSQRFNITNNYIHDNRCTQDGAAGAGFALVNVSGIIRANVFLRNRCWRGGAGFLNDTLNENEVSVVRNLVKDSAGTEPLNAHGGGFYFFLNQLTITGNEFVGNTVTGWGAGLYLGAYTLGGQHTNGRLSWNVYRDNRAGIYGGGFFCDESAKCFSDHEIFDRNCGGNVYVDGASGGAAATIARFDHMTNLNARAVGCSTPGVGLQVDHDNSAPDRTTITNSLFWGNQTGGDLALSCQTSCPALKVTIRWSMVQRSMIVNGAVPVTVGPGILTPRNPLFVAPATGNYHLKSRFGHWTPAGYVADAASSSLLAKGDPASPTNLQPPRAGDRTELGAYGNSSEASYVQ